MKNTILTIILSLSIASLISSGAYAADSNAEKLSRNDQLFREDIQYRLDARLQNQVMTAITWYKAKISAMDKTQADKLTDSIIRKLETILYKMQASQSLDKSLEKKAGDRYLAYMLLKFELMLLK